MAKKRKMGRFTQAKASAKDLEAGDAGNIDPNVLKTIADDVSTPASARVAAAKALVTLSEGERPLTAAAEITRRAFCLPLSPERRSAPIIAPPKQPGAEEREPSLDGE